MNNLDILQQALFRAHEHGYRLKGTLTSDYDHIEVCSLDESTDQMEVEVAGRSGKEKLQFNMHQLLFDVKFARSLFGDLWETHLNLLSSCLDQLEYLQLYITQSRSAA